MPPLRFRDLRGELAPTFLKRGLIRGPQSEILDLFGSTIGPEGAKVLADHLPNSKIVAVNLWANEIGDEGAVALAARLDQLNELYLGGNNIGPMGVRALASALPETRTLNVLGLTSNPLGEDGFAELARAARRGSKTKILLDQKRNSELARTKPDPDGVRELAVFMAMGIFSRLKLLMEDGDNAVMLRVKRWLC